MILSEDFWSTGRYVSRLDGNEFGSIYIYVEKRLRIADSSIGTVASGTIIVIAVAVFLVHRVEGISLRECDF